MTFVLPCSDTASNTRLCRCTAPQTVVASTAASVDCPHSPTNTVQDTDTVNAMETCALIMGNYWDNDDKSFLRDQIALLERDVYAKATKLFALSLWKMLPGMIEDLQDIGCLRVARCGHKFSSMPLLYTARFADSGPTHTSISVKMCRVTSRSHCGRFFVYCAPLCARET